MSPSEGRWKKVLLFGKKQSITAKCVNSRRTNVIFDTHYISNSYSALRYDLYAYKKKKCLFAPPFLKATFSVEAAVVMPIFIFVMVLVMFFFRILMIEWGVGVSGINSVRTFALMKEEDDAVVGAIAAMKGTILVNRVPANYIVGNQMGIILDGSNTNNKDIDITAKYFIKTPINYFGITGFPISQRFRVHKWVGYDPNEDIETEEYVYITPTGVAYHRDIACSYLSPSLSVVLSEDIEFVRNRNAGRYYPCERCGNVNVSVYYIADYGAAFHSSVSCQTLRRSVERVTEHDAMNMGRHACTRCR